MGEFKGVSFVLFDDKGKAHRISCDVIEGEKPNYRIKGDSSLLAKRWRIMSNRIEMFLRGQNEAE